MGGANLIAIHPDDWPKLRVVLEVFFGVGERDGLPEATASLTCNGIGWALGGTRAAGYRAPNDRLSVGHGRLGHQDELSA